MLDQVLRVFSIEPDVDLRLMQPNQTLGGLTANAINAVDSYLRAEKPALVLVQGDTTTVFSVALTCFYHKIPVAHVEAGLRTWNLQSPWPEEANRVLTTRLATLHFAPTECSRRNLLTEGVPEDRVFVTGNTVIDSLLLAMEQVKKAFPHIPGLPEYLQLTSSNLHQARTGTEVVLITGHRRENFGEGFEHICRAIAKLACSFPSTHFVYPVHLNPNVREPVYRILGSGGCPPRNIHLLEPLAYLPFVALMFRSTVILTDSGGVQEEAPSLGKPVLVMRDTTERPEAVSMGTVKLVGTAVDSIVDNVSRLLTDSTAYNAMAKTLNPYGDGQAGKQIARICSQFLTAN
jgi:UDP-N-acetylglucosamine 2-epimerase (non-hydrolysing)